MRNFTYLLIIAVISLFTGITFAATDLAFPGAEGAGKYTTGGRGGTVYVVNSLADDGSAGTLRYAITRSGARIVVFAVSGIIELTSDLKIENDNITIAGQTAPGDGICIKAAPILVDKTVKTEYNSPSFVNNANNVIIRYIRFRPGDEINNVSGVPKDSIRFESDAFFARYRSNIIIDHCSMSWSTDETASIYDNHYSTVQYCIIAESLRDSYHPKDDKAHGYGGIWGGSPGSFHHNLIATHDSRTPRFSGSRFLNDAADQKVDFKNNVIYNWGGNNIYGAEGGIHDLVNNYFKPSSVSTNPSQIIAPNPDEGDYAQAAGVIGDIWVDGNYVNSTASVTNNNWLGVNGTVNTDYKKLTEEYDFSIYALEEQSAKVAYEYVLADAGAVLPKRDSVDMRIIDYTLNKTLPYSGGSKSGFIDSPEDVGGWPTYNSTATLLDSDGDGMPDAWEEANGTNKSVNDASGTNVSGNYYTNIEMYVNSLVEETGKLFVLRPINFTIDSVDYKDVFLSWEDISDNETKFIVERKVYDSDEWSAIDSVDGDIENYTDTTINDFTRYDYRLKAANDSIESFYTESVRIKIENTGIPVTNNNISSVTVYPNPFNDNVRVIVRVDNPTEINLSIYNIEGKEITNLDNGLISVGEYTYHISSDELCPGIYFLRITTESNTKMIQMVKQ